MTVITPSNQWVNTLMPRHNGQHIADDIFKCIFDKKKKKKKLYVDCDFIEVCSQGSSQ